MKNYQVYVISKNGTALMPTKRFGKVRLLLKSGRAKVVSRKPFTIQLQYETTEYTQPLIMGIDPGGKDIGLSVRKLEGDVVFVAHVKVRSIEVAENMKERRMQRRNRRQHRRMRKQRRAKRAGTFFVEKRYQIAGTEKDLVCHRIKPGRIRFLNRKRCLLWRTPTATHLLETHKNVVKRIAKILPVSEVCLEYGKFDIHKLENPEVKGVEYQNGRKKGCTNTQEYVLCRDKHTCRLCGTQEGILHAHHVVWESDE